MTTEPNQERDAKADLALCEQSLLMFIAPANMRLAISKACRTWIERAVRDEEILPALGNLLAVIHGDGGQHTGAVGFLRSCSDAEQKFNALRSSLRDLLEHIEDNRYSMLIEDARRALDSGTEHEP